MTKKRPSRRELERRLDRLDSAPVSADANTGLEADESPTPIVSPARADAIRERSPHYEEGEGWLRPVWPDDVDPAEHPDRFRAFLEERNSLADDLAMIYGRDWVIQLEINALREARERVREERRAEFEAAAES